MRKQGIVFTAALLVLASLFFVPGLSTAQTSLQVGILPVVDTLPLLVGKDKGFFEKKGIDLQLVSFQSALERDAALQAGKLDGYFGDLLNTILLIRSGVDIRIVTTVFAANPEHRMFGIVASKDSGVTNMDQLKGKTVAISRATVIEYLLDSLLSSHGFEPGYVKTEEIKKIPIRLQLLLSGRIDAALLPEPLITLAEINGAVALTDDRRLSSCLTVIALAKGPLEKDPALLNNFLEAYRQAVESINSDPKSFKSLLVEKTRFPKPAQNRFSVPVFPKVAPPSETDINAVWIWLKKKDMAKGDFSAQDVIASP